MGAQTKIEWTDRTFNPWWGCTKVSPGCDHCYAERDSKRFAPGLWGVDGRRREFSDKHWDQPRAWDRVAKASGRTVRVFCASMADVFDVHGTASANRPRLFQLIEQTPHLTWQLLTKRIGNVRKMIPFRWMTGQTNLLRGLSPEPSNWPANCWIGASIVNQAEAERDIPKLLALPAPVRFLSCEPLLGPLELSQGLGLMGAPGDVDWVIVGGESGPHARPMHSTWARQIQRDCARAGVPLFFKQWGEWVPGDQIRSDVAFDKPPSEYPSTHVDFGRQRAYRLGKRQAGRVLDGRTWSEFPA
jgi:protein gp37